MEITETVKRLSALAQEARLQVFRLLVKAGPKGMAAGEIARKLDTAPNTMSAQLLVLSNAGLIGARREGRSIVYFVEFAAVSKLMIYLVEDCCCACPEICVPLAAAASRCCKPIRGIRHETPARSHRR